MSRSTIALAASPAMPRTLVIAADRVAAMVFSASATWRLSFASTSLRRASAAADALARVSLASVCARPRASLKAFSCAAIAASERPLRRCAAARSSATRRRRSSRIDPMRGSAIRDIKRYSAMKVSASQMSWDAKLWASNGGNFRPCSPAGICSVDAMDCALFWAIVLPSGRLRAGRSELEREQQQQRDQEREYPERLGHREAEDEIAKLALSGRRVAQRRGQIVAEDGADADAGAAHADAGDAGTDHFCSLRIHGEAPFGWISGTGVSVARVDRIVEVDAGQDGKDIGLQEGDQQFQRGESNRKAERQE